MKLYTRIISMILALTMAAGYLPQTAWATGMDIREIDEEIVEEIVEEAIAEKEIVLPPVTDSAAAATSGSCGPSAYWRLNGYDLTIYGSGAVTSVPWASETWVYYITVGEGITSLPDRVFRKKPHVITLSLPSTLQTIGSEAFRGLTGLSRFEIPDSVTSIGDSAFYGCDSATYIKLPKNLTRIGDSFFVGCTSLKSIAIPESVTSIGNSAFGGCSKLNGITIPESVTSIGTSAFTNCKELESITIPEGVASIEKSAFSGCEKLESITIPASVNYIGVSATSMCTSLTDIYYGGTLEQWQNITIDIWNESLLNATLHTKGYSGPVSVEEISVICYTNEKPTHKKDESFVLTSGVTAATKDHYWVSGSKGQVSIRGDDDAWVTFSKTGYISRSYTIKELKKNNTIYLQQETEGPVIYGLWYKAQDLLHSELRIPFATDETFNLMPEVIWGENGRGSLTLYQEGHEIPLTDENNAVQIGKYFNIDKEIRLVAIDGAGNKAEKVVKIKNSGENKWDGFSFNLGDAISVTVPDSVPVLGGSKLGFGVFTPVKLKVVEDNGKIYVAIGVTEGMEDGEVKSFSKDVKELKNSVKKASKEVKKAVKAFQKAQGKNTAKLKGSFGVESDLSVVGFAEGYLDENHEFVLADAGCVLMASSKVEKTWNWLWGPVPVIVECSFGLDFEAQMNLYINNKVKEFTPRLELEGEVSASVGAGVGLAKVGSFTGGGKGKMTDILHVDQGKTTYGRVDFTLQLYTKLKVLFVTLEKTLKSKTWTLMEWPDPGTTVMTLGLDDEPEEDYSDLLDFYDTSQYTIDDLSYLQWGSPFMGGVSTFSLRQQSTDGPFVSNAYEGADPQTAFFSDGTRLAVWIGYNEEYSGPDALNLFYSYYNGIWSEPQVVESDGTTDAYPDLKVIGDAAYLVWQDASGSLNGYDDLDSMAGFMDISGAVFDVENGVFNTWSVTENSGVLNVQPKLCGEGDNVYVVWQRNGQNDWFGQNYANSLLCSSFTGDGWDGEIALHSGLGALLDFDVTYANGVRVAYSMDGDCDLNTQEDIEVYINGSQVTSNEYLDSGVTYNGSDLYWYSGGSLLCNGYSVMAEDVRIGSDRFQIVNENGLCAMVYAEENDMATILYAAYYDDASGSWGSPVVLYDAGTSIAAFSAAVTPEGEISVLIQNQEVVGDYESDDPLGMVYLEWYNAPLGCNLRLDDIYYENKDYIPKQDIPVYLTVSNTAELTIPRILVEWLDESGEVLLQKTVEEQLLSGETKEIETAYQITDPTKEKNLTVRVTPVGLDEADIEDNTAEMKLSWSDIAVENLNYGKLEDGGFVIHASVVNYGYEAQQNVVVNLIQGAADGPVVDSVTLSSMDLFALHNVEFNVMLPTQGVYYVQVEHKENDNNYGNDSDFLRMDAAHMPVCTAANHEYGDPEFQWTKEMECALYFGCVNCEHSCSFSCSVTNEEFPATDPQGARTVYTATREIMGQTYTDTKTVIPHQHTAGEEWSSDETHHWKVCTECGEQAERTEHSDGGTSCGQKPVCLVCRKEYGEPAAHDYEGTWTIGDADSHWHNCRNCDAHDRPVRHEMILDTVSGEEICRDCGYRFHNCVGGNTWSFDEEYHWHNCRICSAELEKQAHSLESDPDGSTTLKCIVCFMGYQTTESLDWAMNPAENSTFWATSYYQNVMEHYVNGK